MEYSEIFEECLNIRNEIIMHRRALHSLAEVGFETVQTRQYIMGELEKMGLSPYFIGGGVACLIHGEGNSPFNNNDGKYISKVTEDRKNIPNNEKCVLLRADIDALPICEKTDLNFKATNGNMHACGHDMHASSLLGAASVLSKSKRNLCGTVKLVFQSAEEILSGAKRMIESGILENPVPSCAVSIHTVVGTEYEVGSAIIPSGEKSAPLADFFKITVRGVSGHGAEPHKSKNAALAGAELVARISEASKEKKKGSYSLSVCQISSGYAPNVIPELCQIGGTIRALSSEARQEIIDKINEVCKNVEKKHNCPSTLEITSSTRALKCDEKLVKSAEECLNSLYHSSKISNGARAIKAPNAPLRASTPSEDFSEFAYRIPSVLIGLCAGRASDGFSAPLHNPRVTFDENALPYGAAIYAALGAYFLRN